MKYKVGDKVRIKSLDWYNTNKDLNSEFICKTQSFVKQMADYCGKIATIVHADENYDTYRLDIDRGGWLWEDDMFECRISTETILCAAIHYDNGIKYPHQERYGIKTGFVIAGYRHHNIMPILPVNPFMKPLEDLNVKWGGNEDHTCEQGFLTSTGRFVGRIEAAKIALKSGQVEKLQYSKNMLYSEDLY